MIYEDCSKSSELNFVPLSRSFVRHAMHHSQVLSFTLKMMPISSRCTVSLNSYNILYITHSITLFSCYRTIVVLNLNQTVNFYNHKIKKKVLQFYFWH